MCVGVGVRGSLPTQLQDHQWSPTGPAPFLLGLLLEKFQAACSASGQGPRSLDRLHSWRKGRGRAGLHRTPSSLPTQTPGCPAWSSLLQPAEDALSRCQQSSWQRQQCQEPRSFSWALLRSKPPALGAIPSLREPKVFQHYNDSQGALGKRPMG